MHFAKIGSSLRLQKVLNLLKDGIPHTTRDIIDKAGVCAVNSIIAEIRAIGYNIHCKQVRRGIFEYQLLLF